MSSHSSVNLWGELSYKANPDSSRTGFGLLESILWSERWDDIRCGTPNDRAILITVSRLVQPTINRCVINTYFLLSVMLDLNYK